MTPTTTLRCHKRRRGIWQSWHYRQGRIWDLVWIYQKSAQFYKHIGFWTKTWVGGRFSRKVDKQVHGSSIPQCNHGEIGGGIRASWWFKNREIPSSHVSTSGISFSLSASILISEETLKLKDARSSIQGLGRNDFKCYKTNFGHNSVLGESIQ
jgi:hypothetical protein